MLLSDLVNYKNQLDAISVAQVQTQSSQQLDAMTHIVASNHLQIADLTQRLLEKKQDIILAYDSFQQTLDQLRRQVQALIDDSEKACFIESYRLYEEEMVHVSAEYILQRRPNISTTTENFYRARIKRHNSWQHPAMIIRPGLETYIMELLGTDPLYLVDEKHELLTPAIEMFNDVYQNRLRSYVINERPDQEILDKLPNDQFGLVLVYNFFEFKPFEVIKQYFTEIFNKLKPGGVLAMTFNDCDRDKGVMLVERHFCCYTPGYLVKELGKSLGFEIEFEWSDQGPTTWIEFKKPGQRQSFRGGQALAKIIPK